MKSSAPERKSVVCLLTLLAAAIPIIFTACAGGMMTPTTGSTQSSRLAVSSVVPNSGPLTGGTAVLINGANLSSVTQDIPPSVSFGGVAARQVTIISPLQVRVVIPPHAAGNVSVEVITANGESSTLANGFSYTAKSSTISSVSPNSGPAAGGTTVTVAGSNFSSGATVSFGGTPASGASYMSSTQLRAITPAHAAGIVDVQVTNPDGTGAILANAFKYGSTTFAVTSVSPNSGFTAGGTPVTVNGSGFLSGATVSFGGTAATGVYFVSSSQLQATTPAHAAGAVTVQVTNPDGTSATLANAFIYGSTTLAVTSVSPNSGPTAGGTAVTVNGSNFSSGATISFGGTAASGVSFVNSSQLQATTPAHAAGAVTVQVTNPDGTSAPLANAFNYGSTTLSVTSVSPISGPAEGGTTVTITGSNFQSGASISFGGFPASSITVSNSTTIQATTPTHSSGSATLTVTNPDGQSATLSSGFAFHSVDLAWSAPSSSPVTIVGYNVYRAMSSGGPFGKLNGTTPIADTFYTDGTVQGSTTYFYEVKSVDSNGTESTPEGPAQATTGP